MKRITAVFYFASALCLFGACFVLYSRQRVLIKQLETIIIQQSYHTELINQHRRRIDRAH